jgi:hypothetical protein
MRIFNRTLSLTGKSSKNAVARSNRLPPDSGINSVPSKAAYRMALEVRSGGPVTCILKTSNASADLAVLGSAGKEVVYTAILLLNEDIWFEK